MKTLKEGHVPTLLYGDNLQTKLQNWQKVANKIAFTPVCSRYLD